MIKLFRKIRQGILKESLPDQQAGNRTSKPASPAGRYLLYAIGEIVLVVIGILIALSLNNWNENQKNIRTEKRYVNDLIQDLKNDSIRLHEINVFLESKVASKAKVVALLRDNSLKMDSMDFHFVNQWRIIGRFTPEATTIEELKNSGNLNVIRDVDLRREIVSLYNNYSNEEFTEDVFNQQNVKLLDLASEYFANVLEPRTDEIYNALEDNKFKNGIISNFTFTRKVAINDLQIQCSNLIRNLET